MEMFLRCLRFVTGFLQYAAEIWILLSMVRLESIAVQVCGDRSDVVREQHAS